MKKSKGIQIFALDPGQTTGLAWGVFRNKELRDGKWKDGLASALSAGRLTTVDIDCEDENDGSMFCLAHMESLVRQGSEITDGLVPVATDVVYESFILRERTMDPSLLSPVRVAHKVDALLYAGLCPGVNWRQIRTHWQGADIKSVVTSERLKAWGLWESSVSTHRKDAMKHLVHRVRLLVQAGL